MEVFYIQFSVPPFLVLFQSLLPGCPKFSSFAPPSTMMFCSLGPTTVNQPTVDSKLWSCEPAKPLTLYIDFLRYFVTALKSCLKHPSNVLLASASCFLVPLNQNKSLKSGHIAILLKPYYRVKPKSLLTSNMHEKSLFVHVVLE